MMVGAVLLALAWATLGPADDVRVEALRSGGRALVVRPPTDGKASLLVVYAAPNGATAEETLGRRPRSPAEWKYDGQHVGAQVRRLRSLRPSERIALAVLEAPNKSWPSWLQGSPQRSERARALIGDIRKSFAPDAPVALLAHSGGGSLLLAFAEAGPIPDWVVRIGLLDANYEYANERHGTRLLEWLQGDAGRRLVVVAYDDRFVEVDGKRVVPMDGGTQRATSRMRSMLDPHLVLTKTLVGDCERWTDRAGQVDVRVDRNYANAILHTALVGDMNGVLHALTFGDTDAAAWGAFGPPRAYTAQIDPCEPGPLLALPARPAEALRGSEAVARAATMGAAEREALVVDQVLRGNVPDFLRSMRSVRYKASDAKGAQHSITIWTCADYLAVGADDDFVRMPLTADSARRVAEAAGCLLPTPWLVDRIWEAAECKLAPRPLCGAREALTTFVQHHAIIEEQRRTVPNGPVVGGIKKDLVQCKELAENPGRVAIYGWHRLDAKPIQPLSLAHAAGYVDYSHGVRLISRRAEIDGREVDLSAALRDPNLAQLFSDEGALPAGR